ncbi:MAG: multiheme c-type cytochrome, partial [Pirellulales bacterium]
MRENRYLAPQWAWSLAVAIAFLIAGCTRGEEATARDPVASLVAVAAAGPAESAGQGGAVGRSGAAGVESAVAKPVRRGSLDRAAVDPVKANGPIFEGWPRPEAAILISGELFGYLEPCGCAGLENQKGGLKRRHTLVRQLADRGWPLLEVDLGGQIRRYGPQAEIKFRMAVESLAQIGYQAIGFGPQDLRLSVPQIVFVLSNLPNEKSPFVSANVGLFDFDSGFVDRWRTVTVGKRRVGVTTVLGEKYQQRINNDDLVMKSPSEALAEVVPALRDEADFRILLAYAPPEESKGLAREFPDFDLVVTAGGASEPPAGAVPIEGSKAQLLELGHKGMYVMVVGLFNDPTTPVRVQRVPLDARFKDSPEMQAMLVKYQAELKTLGLEGLGVTPTPHPSGRKFAGSQTCAECHAEATVVWEKTPHAHATETLMKLDPPRHHDPECLSCHVTGWDPQKYYPFTSGYLDLDTTPLLKENGCENCHGPSADHVAAEEGDVEVNDDRLEQLRAQL